MCACAVHVRACVHECTCLFVCVCVCARACVRACVRVCVYLLYIVNVFKQVLNANTLVMFMLVDCLCFIRLHWLHLCRCSRDGWGRRCCYKKKGELMPAPHGSTVIRISAVQQPLIHMRQEYWPRLVCSELANNTNDSYSQLRPTDNCSSYEPLNVGTCSSPLAI